MPRPRWRPNSKGLPSSCGLVRTASTPARRLRTVGSPGPLPPHAGAAGQGRRRLLLGQLRPGRRARRAGTREQRGDPGPVGHSDVQSGRDEIVTYDRYTGDRVAICRALAAERGPALIPPYEHPHVIAGLGTAALELLEEAGSPDTLVVPVGGGLIAGSSTAAKALQPGIRVVGVEPAAIPVPRAIADGQAAETSPSTGTWSTRSRWSPTTPSAKRCGSCASA
ncbi:MAG: threo-3-hydroxy-L-aspartate ammonia-lyase [Actinomycetota bacterium]|nr:threo-3-hydroxy-L-aspartate ammonia-lyase [Actinomycetota bacterium]